MKYEAWRSDTCVQKVQCIAEYQPGLWKDRFGSHNDVFLNPQFLPLRKLPAAADPPEEFVKLRNRRATLLKEKESKHDKNRGFEISQKLEELTERLIGIFEKVRGVKRLRFGSRWNHPWRLVKMTDQHVGFPCDRQAQLYQGKDRQIWVSQPALTDWDYSDPWDEAQVVGFAQQHGLAPTLSPNWGWRWPGETAILEWEKR